MDSIIKFYVIIGSDSKLNRKNDKILCVTTEDDLEEDLKECLEENDVEYDAAEDQADELLDNEDMTIREVYRGYNDDMDFTDRISNFSIRVEKYNLKEYYHY